MKYEFMNEHLPANTSFFRVKNRHSAVVSGQRQAANSYFTRSHSGSRRESTEANQKRRPYQAITTKCEAKNASMRGEQR